MERPGTRVLTNPRSDRVRSVGALFRRSVRARQGLFLAEGPRVVREAIAYRPDAVREVYVDAAAVGDRAGDPRLAALVADARDRGIPVLPADATVVAALCDTQTPQGIVAVCHTIDLPTEHVLAPDPRLLVLLASVRDPGNAGTVIRTADAAGADGVLASADSVDLYNPKLVRATVGSLFHLPIGQGTPIGTLVDEVRRTGLRAFAADGEGDLSVDEIDLSAPHAWVLGNEAWGLPEPVRSACDAVVRVPIYGKAESLNLATASAVCLYSSARAQRAGSPAGRH